MVLLTAPRCPHVTHRHLRPLGTFVPIRAARMPQPARPLKELPQQSHRARHAIPGVMAGSHTSQPLLVQPPIARSPLKACAPVSAAVVAPARKMLFHPPSRSAVSTRILTFKVRNAIRHYPSISTARLDLRLRVKPLRWTQSISVQHKGSPCRRLASSIPVLSISVIPLPPGLLGAPFLLCAARPRCISNTLCRATFRVAPTCRLVVIVVLQFACSKGPSTTTCSSARTWCTIAMTWFTSMPVGCSTAVKIAVFFIRIVFDMAASLGHHGKHRLSFAAAPLGVAQPVAVLPAMHRVPFVPKRINYAPLHSCLAASSGKRTAVSLTGTAWIGRPLSISGVSDALELRHDHIHENLQGLDDGDAQRCGSTSLIAVPSGCPENDSRPEGFCGLYEDTLCEFGTFDGTGTFGTPPQADCPCSSEVEWVDIPPSDEDEVILERAVSFEPAGSSPMDATHEQVLDARLSDADDLPFNEWENEDGAALDKMLQQLDRIAGNQRNEVRQNSDEPMRTENQRKARGQAIKDSTSGAKTGSDGRRWGYSGMRHGLRALKRRLQGKT